MVPKRKEPSEGDVIANRLMVRKADKLRLVASWLPPPTSEELASAKTQEELEQEEKEMFAPVPETLGVGAAPPKDEGDGVLQRKDTSSLAALEQQLLGRHAKPPPGIGSKQGPQSTLADRSTKAVVNVDSDDEGGRTAAFTLRNQQLKTKVSQAPALEEEARLHMDFEDKDTQVKARSSMSSVPAPSKRKVSSFLDEILDSKKKKKKKKKKRTKKDGNIEAKA
ncbi:hypothetical protein FKW77_000440 [Venturia effusa]|uniref:Uncharacterized protein n=1 Tax=Venturia effusa TaxID=50376 RepID=A0A517LHY3_9PEZI|nr:hypothetical protein FKW77_000440 [Venturia effusa]